MADSESSSIAYFRKYSLDDVATMTKLKSSKQRELKRTTAESFPLLEPIVDELLPKGVMQEAKGKGRIQFIVVGKTPLFFRAQHGPLFPTLRFLHKFPTMMKRVQVDKGAIKHLLNGSDIMSPGLVSEGGSLEGDIDEGEAVAIYAEGKTHALALGIMNASADAIRASPRGVGIKMIHFLGDGLWNIGPTFEL